MRKIEKALCRAIKANKPFKLDNTEHRPGVGVFLYGNLIARTYGGYYWWFNMCGRCGPTTKSRINAIANEVGRPGVYTINRQTFSAGEPVSASDWF